MVKRNRSNHRTVGASTDNSKIVTPENFPSQSEARSLQPGPKGTVKDIIIIKHCATNFNAFFLQTTQTFCKAARKMVLRENMEVLDISSSWNLLASVRSFAYI